VADLVTVPADDGEAVHREPSLAKTVDVFLLAARPTSSERGAPRLGRPLEGDGVFLIGLALEVDKGPVDGDFLLLGYEVSVELLTAECLLEVLEGEGTDSFGVGEESLLILARNIAITCEETHLSDDKTLLRLVRSDESPPCLIRRQVASDAVGGEETVGLAAGSNVALSLADATDLRTLFGAVGLAVTRLAAATALAGELALDPLVGTIRGVVARLIAVVAKSGVSTSLVWLRAVTGEVSFGTTARYVRTQQSLQGIAE
jgi:hypothetical protein